jgi:CHAD domain-containing protein
MKKHFLADYVSERIAAVRKDLKKFRKHQKQAHIHSIRVNIKQLRATFHFSGKIFERSFPKKPFKKLYKAAGTLREAHINLGLAERFHYPDKVLKNLKTDQSDLSDRFGVHAPQYLKKVKALAKKTSFPDQLPKKKELRHYFHQEIRETNALLTDKDDEKNLHQFRKKIKEIMYVYEALPTKKQNWVGLNKDYLNNLQLKAGKWHDTFAAIAFFESTQSDSVARLVALKRKEKRERKALLKCCRHFETKIYA